MIRVQREDFDIGRELTALRQNADNNGDDIGAVVSFTGMVRAGGGLTAMTLEHYPGMTEKALSEIEARARARWSLKASVIIHRYGRLELGENIVLVAAASSHRRDAFEATSFMMDYLKTEAPFWKLEERGKETRWVDARESDDAARAAWEISTVK